MSLPYCATSLANSAFKIRLARATGKQIVKLVKDDLKPSQILTKEAFENAIAVDMALGGSTNTTLHLPAIAKEAGLTLPLSTFDDIGRKVPHIMQHDSKRSLRNGGFGCSRRSPSSHERTQNLLNLKLPTVSGKTVGENIKNAKVLDREVIHSLINPVHKEGGIAILTGNLAPKGSVIKTAGVSPENA